MLVVDHLRLAVRALTAHRLRSFLTLLGIAVGIAAVTLLTSIGEGIHRFVLDEFTQFGTHVVEITPGRAATHGRPAVIQSTVRPITLEDAAALERLPHVTAVTPIVWGNAEVSANGRVRRTTVYGAGASLPRVFAMQVRVGRFLPPDDPTHARAYAVLGAKLKTELFGAANPLGARVRIAGHHYRVIGVMEPKGQFLGIDLDDTAYIPAGLALEMFNREGLMEINVSYEEGVAADRVSRPIEQLLSARHGRVDFTLTTQEDMLKTLSNILDILTAAVAALGGISLLVGAVGIVTIMTIAVSERTGEIGLLIALGAGRGSVLALFLGEAAALAAAGGLLGLLLGMGMTQALGLILPALPVHTPWSYVLLAELIAVTLGLAAGVLPARRASRLDPVQALRAE